MRIEKMRPPEKIGHPEKVFHENKIGILGRTSHGPKEAVGRRTPSGDAPRRMISPFEISNSDMFPQGRKSRPISGR